LQKKIILMKKYSNELFITEKEGGLKISLLF